MATPNKFQDYVEQVNKGVHNWSTAAFKAALGNTTPTATMVQLSEITQLSTAGGYTGGAGGGLALDTVTLTETSGTAKVTIADEVFTATGAVGPFQYVTYYNDTATSPADALILWYNHGSAVTLANTETFTLDHDATNGLWQMV